MMKEQIELVTLGNGLRVLCDYLPEAESVAVGVWIETGSRYEGPRRQGISHFLEHMLFKGTRRRSPRRISREIEGRGGVLNGFTSEEMTCYLAMVRAGRFLSAMDLLFDLVWNPRLAGADIEKEKGVIKEEIRLYRDHPGHHAQQLLQETMWPDQPLGRAVLGTEKTVDGIGKKELARYQLSAHQPRRMALVVSGNASPERVFKAAGEFKPPRSAARGRRFEPARYSSSRRPRIVKRPIEQANLCLGVRGLPRSHPDRIALTILSVILGGNMSSRLFHEMREKRGWAYSVSSQANFYRDAGDLTVSAGILPGRAGAAVRLIRGEMDKLSARAVPRRELDRAREYLWGRTILSWEKSVNRMLARGEYLIALNEILTLKSIEEELKRVTPGRVKSLAERIFRRGGERLALVGPADVPPEKAASWLAR